MKILILNWRDPKSLLAGGAEKFTKRYAQHWVSLGHQVTWVTNSFPGSLPKETLDGINYIRITPQLTGKLVNYLFYYPIFLLKIIVFSYFFIKNNNIDLVIDEIHGLPFFTPIFSKKRNILLVCEVAGEIWDKMFPFPINVIGKKLELFIYSLYKSTEIWAISENTKNNINDLLLHTDVKILTPGLDIDKKQIQLNHKKSFNPSAVFLSRLVKMKGVEVAINAAYEIQKHEPSFKLYILGSASKKYQNLLIKMVDDLRIRKNIEFLGYVSEKKKNYFLSKAHFLIHPSYKEGFGLTILEAGILGTPSIVRKGSGMDMLIEDGKNGYKFSDDSEISKLFLDNYLGSKFKKLSSYSKIYAQKYDWDVVLKKSNIITNIEKN